MKSNICVVCSRWEEPFGRTALEASSSGCAVIISKKGGLPEASPKALKLKNLSVKNLENILSKIIKNKSLMRKNQKEVLKNFNFTNELISKKIDRYRSEIIKY